MKKKPKAYLAPDVILGMILGKDEHMERIIDSDDVTCIISDFGLYEAIGCLKPKDKINLKNLQKLLEKAEFVTSDVKPKLTKERITKLRKRIK